MREATGIMRHMCARRVIAVLVCAAAIVAFSVARAEDAEVKDLKTEIERAKKLVDSGKAKNGYLVAGDAYSAHGLYGKAVPAYQKVLPQQRNPQLDDIGKKAQAGLDAIAAKVGEAIDKKALRDGTYSSSSVGYVGPVTVTVIVRSGKIVSARVTKHEENRALTSITDVPKRITNKGDVRHVDVVTGATITSRAILRAATYALAGAVPPPPAGGTAKKEDAPKKEG